MWLEAQPGWLGTLPRSFNWGRESLQKETGNPTRSRRKNLEVAQDITHYQRRSRELSQSLFGIGQTIFLMNEHYLLSIFFPIRFPNKRNGLNLLNKNRMNFSLKNKKPFSWVVTFSPVLGTELRAALMHGKCFNLWATYMFGFWISTNPDKLSWTSPGPAPSPFIEWNCFQECLFKATSRHWQRRFIKECTGTFI